VGGGVGGIGGRGFLVVDSDEFTIIPI